MMAQTLDGHQGRTVDGQGGTSTFAFTNLKENIDLPDSQFQFKMPKGVDVVTDGR